MQFHSRDLVHLVAYTTLFSVLLFGYNIALSPSSETTFNSASINNREEPVAAEAISQDVPSESVPSPEESSLEIVFNPETITVDSSLLGRLREQVDSHYFASKVTPLRVLLDADRSDPRGQVVGNKLILSTRIPSDSESLKVLVHELGHIVDISYLKKGALMSDPSKEFYDISWTAYNVLKKEMKIADFVSGYALSNQYEDFAESFTFYIFHNDLFVARAKKNPTLQKKYDFLRTKVFDSDEFVGTAFQTGAVASYNWDTTKIGVNLKKYLYYIR